MADSAVEKLERWEDFGAAWRVLHLTDRHAIVELRTCHGEPVDRLESGDPALIAFLRERAAAEAAEHGDV